MKRNTYEETKTGLYHLHTARQTEGSVLAGYLASLASSRESQSPSGCIPTALHHWHRGELVRALIPLR